MNIINKLLNPFGDKSDNKKEYKDLSKDSQKIAPNTPSDLLISARNIAGRQIQEHMEILNGAQWIRADYTYPAFDSMNFLYKTRVFSVVIDIQDKNGKSYLPEELIKRQLYAAQKYNLIPCKFIVTVPNPFEPELDKLCAKADGWNLYDTVTNEEIIPEMVVQNEKFELSDWELRFYGIRFVMQYLQSKKLRVSSYQDTLEVDPQIWFEDAHGRRCWITVRCARMSEKNLKKPKKMKEIIRRCFKNDGYYAGIVLTPKAQDVKKLYRGKDIKISFNGFEKIHSVM